MKTCNEEGCDSNVWSNGKCRFHTKPRRKSKKVKNIGVSIDALDRVFSRYIRTKAAEIGDGVIYCYICKTPLDMMSAVLMHYFGRSNLSTRFDEKNCKAGCLTCNSFLAGNLEEFKKELILEYGPNIIKTLEKQSKKICQISQTQRSQLLKKWNKYLRN